MVLTGVWIAGSNVTEPHPFVSVCVCVCALCILAAQRGFTQYRPCQLEFCCSLSTQRAATPRAPSRAHALSACDGSVGSPLSSPRKKSTKGGAPSDRSQLHFSHSEDWWRWSSFQWESRNKWPSETHYTSARFGEWSDTAPDYQIHHLCWFSRLFHKCQRENRFMSCTVKEKSQERKILAKWRNSPLFICDT